MGASVSPQVIGRYALYGKIASGGMASVCFGTAFGAVGFSRTVAVKRLHPHLAEDPEFVSAMIDEARLAARIHHPNVVPTLDVVAADGELLVVMEYVRGESLARLLRAESARKRRVPPAIVSAIVIGALHGLHAAHEATSDRGEPLGIVHRDVSPQNILVGVDGVARVIDFGVAKAAGRLQTTREGTVKGKMAYMAPEQISARDVTRAADVYAMGVVLWEALTGKRLFQAENDAAVFGLVLAGAKDPPSRHMPDLPTALDALVMTALAPAATERFASALDMAEMLLRVLPPAFSTTVGKWVEEAASEALAQRGAALAEVESRSGAAMTSPPTSAHVALASGSRRVVSRPPPAPALAGGDDAPTIASEPSSLSVETPPRPSLRGPARSRRAKLAAALGAAALLVAGIATLLFRGQSTPGAPTAAAAASTAAEPNIAAPVPTSALPLPAPSAREAPGTEAPSALARQLGARVLSPAPPHTSTEASATVAHPAPPSKPRVVAPKPTGSLRFAQPD